MYDEFVGHPLRKDYPQNARQPLLRRPDAPPTDDQTTRLIEGSHDRRTSG
jgi:NADH:ubiquinone oxidoreductase subunit C